jgi:hypothetical protein
MYYLPFVGTRRFIAVLRRPRHRPLSWVKWIQPAPSRIVSLIYILILSPRLQELMKEIAVALHNYSFLFLIIWDPSELSHVPRSPLVIYGPTTWFHHKCRTKLLLVKETARLNFGSGQMAGPEVWPLVTCVVLRTVALSTLAATLCSAELWLEG